MSIQKRIFHPAFSTIYLDMDGVVADFDKFLIENIGRTFNHINGPGADTEIWDFLKTVPNFYAKLDETDYAKDLWAITNLICANVEFLTAIPRRSTMPSAESDKIYWLYKHFGKNAKINFGPYSRDKINYLEFHQIPHNPLYVAVDVLIDDREDNIKAWNEAGGIGILHKYDDYESTKRRLLLLQHTEFNSDFRSLAQ